MESADDVRTAFQSALQALLTQWGATIEAEDHYPGYPECGQDIRMTVVVPSIYNIDGNCEREYCEIDLGREQRGSG